MCKGALSSCLSCAVAVAVLGCGSEPDVIALEVDFVLPDDTAFLDSIESYRARVYYFGGEKAGALYEGEYSRGGEAPTVLDDLLPTEDDEFLTIEVEGVSTNPDDSGTEMVVARARSGPVSVPGADRVVLFLGQVASFNLLADPLPATLIGHASAGNGQGAILLAGGLDADGEASSRTWIFDDGYLSHIFGGVAEGPEMEAPRVHHTAQMISSPPGDSAGQGAQIAVLGGESVERMHFVATGPGMFVPELDASATSLPLGSVEILDPASLEFEAGPALLNRRAFHTAVVLDEQAVLLCCGLIGDMEDEQASIRIGNTCEIWASAAGAGSGFSLRNDRIFHAMTMLENGRVLLTGGVTGLVVAPDNLVAESEWVDPADPVPNVVGSLLLPRAGHSAVVIPGTEGKVLISGGYVSTGSDDGATVDIAGNAEIFDPSGAYDLPFTEGPEMMCPRVFHHAIPLTDGRVLIYGGQGRDPESRPAPEVYDHEAGTFSFLYEDSTGCGEFGGLNDTAETLPSSAGGATAQAVMSDGSLLISGGSWTPVAESLQGGDRVVAYVP